MFRVFLILISILFLTNCTSRVAFSSIDAPLSSEELQAYGLPQGSGNNILSVPPSGLPGTGSGVVLSPVGGAGNPSGNLPIVPSQNSGVGSAGAGNTSSGTSTSCSQNATNMTFNIFSQISISSFYNYTGKFLMSVNEIDLSLNKYAFLAVNVSNVLYLYNFKTGQFMEAAKIANKADYALNLPTDKCQFPYSVFEFKNADLTAYGGSTIYSGYGVGSSADQAANEMIFFRDASHFKGRYNELFTVPVQPASVTITNIGYADTLLQGVANISVRSADYFKSGYYFIAANSADGSVWYLYNGSSWFQYTGSNFISIGGVQQLKNISISFSADVTNSQLAGFKLYAGYGLSSNVNQAFNAFVSNSDGTRNSSPYILQQNPSVEKNKTNYNISAYSSGAVSNYSIFSIIKIADAHLEQAGYVLGVIQFQSEYYVYNSQQKRFVKWDGVLASFPAASKLFSQANYVTFASNLDVTAFGGAKLYIGYGVGSTPSQAVNEMLAAVRWREVGTIPAQSFSASVAIPSYSKSSTAMVDIEFNVSPNYFDYDQAGKYYVIVSTSDNSSYSVLTASTVSIGMNQGMIDCGLSGVSWVNYSSTAQDSSLYTYSTQNVKNFKTKFSIRGVDLAIYAGYKLYAGYGKSISEMLKNNTFSAAAIIP